MRWIKRLFERLHVCSFSKPIASRYITFNHRDIVYECRCGKRRIERVYASFGQPFPIETNMLISKQELEKIANEKVN